MTATDVAVKKTLTKSAGYNKPYCSVLYYSLEKPLDCFEINTALTDVAIKKTFKKYHNYNVKYNLSLVAQKNLFCVLYEMNIYSLFTDVAFERWLKSTNA